MLARRALLASLKARRHTTLPVTTWLRHNSNSSGRKQGGDHEHIPSFIDEHLSAPAAAALVVGKRALKYSLVTVLTLGLTFGSIFEGLHVYVESVSLAPRDEDEETRKWQWDLEAEGWTGDASKGGTDIGLGLRGTHIVRMAYMCENWALSDDAYLVKTKSRQSEEDVLNLKAVHPDLLRIDHLLRSAIFIAEGRALDGKLHPQTLPVLLARHAALLERMGPEHLLEARSQYERVWAGIGGKGLRAARVALKLGDLNRRLGQPDTSLAWWSRAIYLTRDESSTSDAMGDLTPSAPPQAPTSPLAQRILASTLISVSAFYATSGQRRRAQSFEEDSLALIRSIPPPASIATASPPQALHHLTLLQRSSVLSTHLAEVLYDGKKKSTISSFQWLSSAAESSERVAKALTGVPPSAPIPTDTKDVVVASNGALAGSFAESATLHKPASVLLRDARRTAAAAWNLMGILSEQMDKSKPQRSLECYERAVGWAGSITNKEEAGKPFKHTLESEWTTIWGNYARVRRALGKGEK